VFFARLDEGDCKDLAQTAFQQTWEEMSTCAFDPERNGWAWVRRVARNRAIDYRRPAILAAALLVLACGTITSNEVAK